MASIFFKLHNSETEYASAEDAAGAYIVEETRGWGSPPMSPVWGNIISGPYFRDPEGHVVPLPVRDLESAMADYQAKVRRREERAAGEVALRADFEAYGALPAVCLCGNGVTGEWPQLLRARGEPVWEPANRMTDWNVAVVVSSRGLDGFRFTHEKRFLAAKEWQRRYPDPAEVESREGRKAWARRADNHANRIMAAAATP